MRKIIFWVLLLCVGTTKAQDIDAVSGATRKTVDTISVVDDSYNTIRFGGYGEMVANFKDYGINRFYGNSEGNPKANRNTIAIPRFVVAFDYKFNAKWQLGAEIEFESGGTGQAVELENTENGEYETEVEKGGEVVLEQFHISYSFSKALNFRFGHMVLPIGLTNAHHEPINFFGTSRPEGETTIIPSTWHESGIGVFGDLGKGVASFSYEAMIVAGLNANGFDRNNWVASGKQGFFEADCFNSPAYVARIDWKGFKGLRVGGSIYYCHDTGANSDKQQTYAAIDNATLCIWSTDAQYKNKMLTARVNLISGNLAESDVLTGKNAKLSNKSPYSRTGPIAKRAITYGGEIGVHLGGLFSNLPQITPFVHYEYYNPQEEGVGKQSMDKRCQVSMWSFGVNYNILPNLVAKFDYTTRQIGTKKMFGQGVYNSENEFAIGLAYVGWFTKK